MMPPPPADAGGGSGDVGLSSKNSKYLKTMGAPRRPVIVLSYIQLRKATRRLTPM